MTDHSHDPHASATMDTEGNLQVFSGGRSVHNEAKQDQVAGRLARAMGFSEEASTREDLKAALDDARNHAERSESYQAFFPGSA
ncbi:hypothetical protein [Pseudactinotalea sp. Z1748]|uniref:hypothetical protein n=1 Tax=Pseudactinotalea sp. Z1748 TaxID=3413027 RepID=UPI003C7AAE83